MNYVHIWEMNFLCFVFLEKKLINQTVLKMTGRNLFMKFEFYINLFHLSLRRKLKVWSLFVMNWFKLRMMLKAQQWMILWGIQIVLWCLVYLCINVSSYFLFLLKTWVSTFATSLQVAKTFNLSLSGASSRACKYILNTLMQVCA